ncbi:hypothetical protein KW782_01975 [Candidatus Parcubacteria bacterium]|nr:hypothetical protein [Candidatus Parcubacteria bacterium]
MDRAKLSEILRDVRAGTKLRLAFNLGQGQNQTLDGGTRTAVLYFKGMLGSNLRLENQADQATINAVILSGLWENPQNRFFTVIVPEKFDQDWFKQRLRDGLESVDVL